MPSLLGDLCQLSFRVTPQQGGLREVGVLSLAPLTIWLRAAGGRRGPSPLALAQMQVLAAGRAQRCVAGVLTASTTLTEARPGGPAGPLEGGSSQPSYHSSLLSMPVELPSPGPSCCGQTRPTGASHQYHIHGVQQILKEHLLCACRVPWRERGSCHSQSSKGSQHK